jgi:pilus assembly protein CpaB
MNRRSRHIAVVSIAVATASLASFGVYRAVTRIPVREVEVARAYAVVAARSLPPGVRLGRDDVRLAAWPANSVVPGAFASVEAVLNRGLLAAVVENEPITTAKLAPAEAGGGLPPAIPAGMRAMSVRINEVIGVAGFVDPGTRVDLLVTIRGREESTSRTVVSNVEVLSAGTRSEQEKARGGTVADVGAAVRALVSTPPAVVTLLVAPEDAERIALAQAEGQIVLVLRNPLDTQPTVTAGVRTASLFGPTAAPTPPPPVTKRIAPRQPAPTVVAPEPVAAPKPYMVEAFRAAKRTEEEVMR